jgi:hypothetical protein
MIIFPSIELRKRKLTGAKRAITCMECARRCQSERGGSGHWQVVLTGDAQVSWHRSSGYPLFQGAIEDATRLKNALSEGVNLSLRFS